MSYTISSKLLSTDYREEMIQKTLDLYRAGADLKDSPLVEWGRKVVARGDWWYGCEGLAGEELETGLLRRQREVIKLYHSLKEKGYTGSPISIYFDKVTGNVHVYDGFHRLSIMKYLGLEVDINCVVSHHNPNPDLRGDFPLADTIRGFNGGDNLYQPVDDARVEGWNVWRHDCQIRLDFLLDDVLVSGSVVDVGCSEGWFTRALARAGFKVTALDHNGKRLAVTNYLAVIKNLEIDTILGNWQHELRGRHFDNILMLSVLHHLLLRCGQDQVFTDLKVLRGSCQRLVVEMPLEAKGVKWLDEARKDTWSFTQSELIERLEKSTQMKLLKVGVCYLKDRPLIVLEA